MKGRKKHKAVKNKKLNQNNRNNFNCSRITSQYHTGGTGAGNINVVFIDTANQNKSKTKTYSTTYPSATNGEGMEDFVVHPAFDFGGEHLEGFWMEKFESSHTRCTQASNTGSATYTGKEVMMVKSNVTSWRKISVNNISQEFQEIR